MRVRVFVVFQVLFFSLCVFLLPAHRAAAATTPIAWWKFDDGSGTTPVDSSSNNITGSFTTVHPTWSTDVPSVSFSDPYSLDFTGTGDGVHFSWPSGLNMAATDPRTFSVWFKPIGDGETSGSSYDRIYSWTSDAFEVAGNFGSPSVHEIAFYDGSWEDTGFALTPGTWYHITFTFDGQSEYLYVGDVQKYAASTTARALSGTFAVGTRVQGPDNEGINGRIDDVRIYNSALSASQIANLTAGSSDPDTPPDTTPPVISAVASSTSSTGATVTWTTDEAASTQVAYSVDTSFASSTTETDTGSRVTSHSQSLTGLLSCTWYNFKAVSADAASNYATSTKKTFLTTGCPGGATPTSLASTTVTVSSAATSTDTDSGRTLTIATPANFTATSSSVVIQIKGMDSSTVLGSLGKPSGLSSAASVAFDVSALIDNVTTLDSFDSPVTITYHYTEADVSGLDESSLTMYHYHGGSWLQLNSCTVDTSANTITCTAPSFSTFALFGTAASSNSSSSSSSGDSGIPWCSGPSAPGWNVSLPDGGCGHTANVVVAPVAAPHVTATLCPYYRFARSLQFGNTGEDVRALQKFLNCAGFPLAKSGPGSSGEETVNFSDRTLQSVKKYQQAYSSDILLPIQTTTPTGIFARYSKAKAYSLMEPQ